MPSPFNTELDRVQLQDRSVIEKSTDRLFVSVTAVCAAMVVMILIGIGLEVTIQAWPAIQAYGGSFLIQARWDPVKAVYGIGPMIYGTVVSSLIGLAFAIPLGLGSAIVLSESLLPRSLRIPLTIGIELLAAVPSVVYGLWGIFVLIPWLREIGSWLHTHVGFIPLFGTDPAGPGLLPSGMILAIMTLPIITAISRQSLAALPPDWRAVSVGLGATSWQTILRTLLPAASPGIVGGIILALGRAFGETMAVTMVIGNSNQFNWSILAPANTLASLIASQFAEASGLQVSALMYAGLVLFVVTLGVNLVAEWWVGRLSQP